MVVLGRTPALPGSTRRISASREWTRPALEVAFADREPGLGAGSAAFFALSVGPDGGHQRVESDVNLHRTAAALAVGSELPALEGLEHLVADGADGQVALDHLLLLPHPAEV